VKSVAICIGAFGLLITPASAAQHWNVDVAKSKLGFSVNWGGEPFIGVFHAWKADIDFDPADLSHSHASITIDTGSEASGDSETDAGVKGAVGFASSQFPTAMFRTTGLHAQVWQRLCGGGHTVDQRCFTACYVALHADPVR
jgi:polyisoprenoid-binding protein YceI